MQDNEHFQLLFAGDLGRGSHAEGDIHYLSSLWKLQNKQGLKIIRVGSLKKKRLRLAGRFELEFLISFRDNRLLVTQITHTLNSVKKIFQIIPQIT